MGGKSLVLKEIRKFYPTKIKKYCEPFVGGGAVLFDILSLYDVKEVYISDLNKELINTYKVIRDNINELIEILSKLKGEFLALDQQQRKIYFLQKREEFNFYIKNGENKIYGSALFIFINKTCFNGLYRVNKNGLFNSPFGSYKNPEIFNEEILRNISLKLRKSKIVYGDYKNCKNFIDNDTFVYLDPPYRPISLTSNFVAYNSQKFSDKQQIELASFFKEISDKKAKVVLSNSDPKNHNIEDNFFDILYSKFNINRIYVKRFINSNAQSKERLANF